MATIAITTYNYRLFTGITDVTGTRPRKCIHLLQKPRSLLSWRIARNVAATRGGHRHRLFTRLLGDHCRLLKHRRRKVPLFGSPCPAAWCRARATSVGCYFRSDPSNSSAKSTARNGEKSRSSVPIPPSILTQISFTHRVLVPPNMMKSRGSSQKKAPKTTNKMSLKGRCATATNCRFWSFDVSWRCRRIGTMQQIKMFRCSQHAWDDHAVSQPLSDTLW